MKTWAQQFRIKSQHFWRRQYFQFETIWDRSSRRKKTGIFVAVYTMLFLVTFSLAYSPFLQEGKSFISSYDGRNQHYPTLVYIGRYFRLIILNLLQGDFSIPLFDLNIGLGADIISTLTFYGFGDPLSLPAVFIPTKYIEVFYNFLIIFRMYLSGLTFSALCIYHKKRVSFTMIGALMYVFSGYAVYSALSSPRFIDPMVQLPLLLIGVDQIICRKKPFLFIAAVFYSALYGFYFLYMMTIIVGIYALIRFFDYHFVNRIKEFIQMVWRTIWTYSLGIGMASVLFLPSVIGYFSSERAGATIDRNYLSYGWATYRNNLLRVIAPPGSSDILSLAAITLLAVVLLFSARKKRRSLKLLFTAGACIYLLPLGGFIMNGFGYPSNRWTFGLALLLSYIVVEMLPSLLNLRHRQKLICFGTQFAYMLCIFFSPTNRSAYYVVGVAMLGITLIVLLLVNESVLIKQKMKHLGAVACVLLMVGNVSVNAIYRFSADQANYISEFTKYGAETKRLESALIREAEPYLKQNQGRVDGSSSFRNTGMVWRISALSSYWSITNSNVPNYWTKLENIRQQRGSFNIHGVDHRTIMSTLLSTRYFVSGKGSTQYVPYGYTLIKEKRNGNAVYENQYALPWGYTYDSYTSYDVLEKLNGLELEEAMLQTVALDEDVEGIPIGSVESDLKVVPYEIKSMQNVEWEEGILKVTKANAIMTMEFKLPKQAEGYLRLQGFDINDSGQDYLDVKVECDGVSNHAEAASTLSNWYFGRENYLFNLGYSENERTVCTITFPAKGTFRLDEIQLYALPMNRYPQQVEALRAEPLENIEFTSNRVVGTVDLSKSKILCMSIPYSSGWTARVDGKKVDIFRGNYMFMAIPLMAGYHNIEFSYCTPGLKLGVILTVASTCVVAGMLAHERRKKTNCNNI